jgi:chemotaxis protein CheD
MEMRFEAGALDICLDKHVVDISAFTVSDNPDAMLVTYSLGSCMGLSVYDPVTMIGGLIHCLLPLSRLKPEESEIRPAMFVDTGVPAMLDTMFSMGAVKNRLVLKAAGCGQLMNSSDVFQVGRENYKILKKLLIKNCLRLSAEHVGGMLARTMRLHIGSGNVTVHAAGQRITL